MTLSRCLPALGLFFLCLPARAQDGYRLSLDLRNTAPGELKVVLYTPAVQEQKAVFIIPVIVPGTYMKVNYGRFYRNFKAYDREGSRLPLHRKGHNKVLIRHADRLSRLEYTVKQSHLAGRIWDNILTCAGTVFEPGKLYLLNFQLVTGYLGHYDKKPFELSIRKPDSLHVSTSLPRSTDAGEEYVFKVPDYATLVDNPVMVCKADTASYTVGSTRYHIAVHSDRGLVHAADLENALRPVSGAVDRFFKGNFPASEYTYLMYYFDETRHKGLLKSFGVGSALEHQNGSAYYLYDRPDTNNMAAILNRNLSWIGSHEMMHKLLPLGMRSHEVDSFNFAKPVMSEHVWMYEGFTDYFANLAAARNKLTLPEKFVDEMRSAYATSSSRKDRSLTRSSRHIIKHNAFDWIFKMLQLESFYMKGKLIAFFMDLEIYQQSGGQKRLEDVMLELAGKYRPGRPFSDSAILNEIAQRTNPAVEALLQQQAVGGEPLPYGKYFDALGWEYFPKRSRVPSYGNVVIRWRGNEIGVGKAKKNTLGLQKGDVLLRADTAIIVAANSYAFYRSFYYPRSGDTMRLTVRRSGQELTLSGAPLRRRKPKMALLRPKKDRTEEQLRLEEGMLAPRTATQSNVKTAP